jgi:hypothetical protein
MENKIRMTEGVWHPIHNGEDRHVYLNLEKDQCERVYFDRTSGRHFIILPPL